MHEMTQHYLICALWSSTDNTTPQGGEPLDANYSLDDIAPESLEQAERDCLAFLEAHEELIAGQYQRAGHDFWLTRNRHGAGFWDGDWEEATGDALTVASYTYRELTPIVGDDGLIYFE